MLSIAIITNTTDTAIVDFSLRSNLTNVNFITIDNGFRFFNCSTHTRYIVNMKFTLCLYHNAFIFVVVTLVYHPVIYVGGVYMIRNVPHPVISVDYQLIGTMLVVLIYQ